MRTHPATKKSPAKIPQERPAQWVRGEVVLRPLELVQKNSWNPNKLTQFMFESLERGLKEDGWLISESLLIWGKDEKGKERNIIIDGEHRWTAAKILGFKKGPMVFLDGLTEMQAKALTIKMNQKRGTFDTDELGKLVRDIQFGIGGASGSISLDLGIPEEQLMKLLATPAVDLNAIADQAAKPGVTPGDVESGMTSHVRMVQLFFNKEQHEEFLACVKDLAPKLKTENNSDTVLEALRRAHPTKKQNS